MSNYRFSLEKYSGPNSRYTCPNCKRKREFVRYIDTITMEHIANHVGKCNRLDKCGHHYSPKDYFKHNKLNYKATPIRRTFKQDNPTYYYDRALVTESIHSENRVSNLYSFLITYFPKDSVMQTLNKYFVGVSNKLLGAVIFWQIDTENRVRAGKVMQYNKNTGKRSKGYINWIKKPPGNNSKMRQCFFGAHLLKDDLNCRVAIVESEKTALICNLYFDEDEDEKFIWIATGGLQGLNEEGFKDLIGREVILFPDLSAIDTKNKAISIWAKKGKEIGKKLKIDIKLNMHLEKIATDEQRENQEDIADFIIRKLMIETI